MSQLARRLGVLPTLPFILQRHIVSLALPPPPIVRLLSGQFAVLLFPRSFFFLILPAWSLLNRAPLPVLSFFLPLFFKKMCKCILTFSPAFTDSEYFVNFSGQTQESVRTVGDD